MHTWHLYYGCVHHDRPSSSFGKTSYPVRPWPEAAGTTPVSSSSGSRGRRRSDGAAKHAGAMSPLKTEVPYLILIVSCVCHCGDQIVAHTSIAKPATWSNESGKTSFSHPVARLTIQIPSVLHVSMRLLAVALTRAVTLRPKKLKEPILIMIAIQVQNTRGVWMI